MLVLGIETSTTQSSVCLATERGIVAGAALGRGRAHGEFLAPAIRFSLDQAGVGVDAVSGVAVSVGPGLYTGMRVGMATAQTLAHARRLPMVGLASLDLVAFNVRHVRRLICAVIDARRGELFWAFYRSAPGGVQRVTDYRVGAAERLAGEIGATHDDVLCVGDGAVAAKPVLESAGAEAPDAIGVGSPSAQSLVELALPRFLREETERPEDVRPIYLRRPDARISWRDRGALLGGKPPEGASLLARGEGA